MFLPIKWFDLIFIETKKNTENTPRALHLSAWISRNVLKDI